MKISINDPCHENWNEMTPNEKGAFCLSCQKTVVDFSKKSIGEIKDFFVKKPLDERVCGRFMTNQFLELEFDRFIEEFMSWKFLKRAAVICFLVIGTTLFSSCSAGSDNKSNNNNNDYEYEHTAGMVAVDDSLNNKQLQDTLSSLTAGDSLKTNMPGLEKKKKKKDCVKPSEPMHLKGDVDVSYR